MTCKNICVKYKVPMRYVPGVANCRSCDMFIRWDGRYCPCCGIRVSRTKRRSSSRS